MLSIINERIKFEVGRPAPAGTAAGKGRGSWDAGVARADEQDPGLCCLGCFRGACRA
jgi:hypothetical protein